jgi:hypothetical protein
MDGYTKISICPLQQGLIPQREEHNMTEAMCVPVYPEILHPTGRPPLKTNKPLPWAGCYHPRCLHVSAFAPEESIDYTQAYRLPVQERVAMMYHCGEDDDARHGVIRVDEEHSNVKDQDGEEVAEAEEWSDTDLQSTYSLDIGYSTNMMQVSKKRFLIGIPTRRRLLSQ